MVSVSILNTHEPKNLRSFISQANKNIRAQISAEIKAERKKFSEEMMKKRKLEKEKRLIKIPRGIKKEGLIKLIMDNKKHFEKIDIKKNVSQKDKIKELDDELKTKTAQIKNMNSKELNELSKKYMNYKELVGLNNKKHSGIVKEIVKRQRILKNPKITITEAEEPKGGGKAEAKSTLPPIPKSNIKIRVAPKKQPEKPKAKLGESGIGKKRKREDKPIKRKVLDVPRKSPKAQVFSKGGKFFKPKEKKEEPKKEQPDFTIYNRILKLYNENKKLFDEIKDERFDIGTSIFDDSSPTYGQLVKRFKQFSDQNKKGNKKELIELEEDLIKILKKQKKPAQKKKVQKPKPKKQEAGPAATDEEILEDIIEGRKNINELRKTSDFNLFEEWKDRYGGMQLNKEDVIKMLQPQEYTELAKKYGIKKVFKFLNKFWSKLKSNNNKRQKVVNDEKSMEELFKTNSNEFYLLGLNSNIDNYRGTITDIGENSSQDFIEKYSKEPKKEKPKTAQKKEEPKPKLSKEKKERIQKKVQELGKKKVQEKRKRADAIQTRAIEEKLKQPEKPKKKPKPPADEVSRIPLMIEAAKSARKRKNPATGLELQLRELDKQYDLSGFNLDFLKDEKPKTQEKKTDKPKKKKKKESRLERIRRERKEAIERDKGKIIPEINDFSKNAQKEFFKYLKEENEDGFTLEDQKDLLDYMEDLADRLPKERAARQELNDFDKERMILFNALFPKEYIQYIEVVNDITGRKEGIVAAQEKKAAKEQAAAEKKRSQEALKIEKQMRKEAEAEAKQKAKDKKEYEAYIKKNPFKN